MFFAHVDFLGDYQGLAATAAGVHAVWCRSFYDGEHLNKRYNQSTWSATIT